MSPCPILFCGTQSASPARAFFDGRRPARADPRQAGRRRIVAEPDRFDQAAFDASPKFAAHGAGAVRPRVGQGGLCGPDRGLGGVAAGRVRERGYRLRRPGLPSAAGGPVRVRYPALPRAAMILPASSHSLQDPSTFRCWRGRMPPWRGTARSRRLRGCRGAPGLDAPHRLMPVLDPCTRPSSPKAAWHPPWRRPGSSCAAPSGRQGASRGLPPAGAPGAEPRGACPSRRGALRPSSTQCPACLSPMPVGSLNVHALVLQAGACGPLRCL